MSKGQDMSVLVMDVEGTDGRERGEDQVRQSPPRAPSFPLTNRGHLTGL